MLYPFPRTGLAASALAVLLAGGALAQTPPPAGPPPAPPPVAGVPPDPVVATVNGADIRLSDVNDAAQSLPEQMRGMPNQMLYPMLLDQLIDRKALAVAARQAGLDKDPEVVHQIDGAVDRTLQTALIRRDVSPMITEEAIRARYDATIAGKPGEQEVHAAHILVANEDTAKKLIAELKAGADFAELAKKNSTDPAAAQGGDLGFFKQGDMLPEFSAVAFALKPGEVADTPAHTRYGWHVIKLIERRQAPAQTFEQAHDELRQQIIQEGVQKTIASARAAATVQKFNPDGTPARATDSAQPPPPKP